MSDDMIRFLHEKRMEAKGDEQEISEASKVKSLYQKLIKAEESMQKAYSLLMAEMKKLAYSQDLKLEIEQVAEAFGGGSIFLEDAFEKFNSLVDKF